MEGDGNLCQEPKRRGIKRGKCLLTEIEATEGEENTRNHEGDKKSLRQAKKKKQRDGGEE